MHRYLPGLLLVQIITIGLFWLVIEAEPKVMLLQAGVPALVVTLLTALWFASVGKSGAQKAITKLRLNHAREREKLQIDAERTKAQVLHRSQKEIRKRERQVNRSASIKVGLAFAGAGAAGVLLLITELFTMGLMTITTSLGGLGGYLLRMRQSRSVQAAPPGNDAAGHDMQLPDPLITTQHLPVPAITADKTESR